MTLTSEDRRRLLDQLKRRRIKVWDLIAHCEQLLVMEGRVRHKLGRLRSDTQLNTLLKTAGWKR